MTCYLGISNFLEEISAAAAKSLQSCPTLCDPINGSPPGSPVPGILQARTLEWVAISSPMHESEKWKWSRSVLSESLRPHGLYVAYQAPPSMRFSRQEYWSGVPLPSLEEISSLSHCIVFLYFFALISEEGFLISPCYSLELCIQMGISFLFCFAFHFSSFHSYL